MGTKVMIILDFETYSPLSIDVGAKKYASHEETDIVCLAYKHNDKPTRTWRPGQEVPEVFYDVHTKLYAHYAQFDYLIWHLVGSRYGFPVRRLNNWVDTQALTMRYSLPGALAKAGEVLNLEVQKNTRGKALMRKISFPLKDGLRPILGVNFTTQDLHDYIDYCVDDVNSTYHLVKSLPSSKLSDEEQYYWELTAHMNMRGLPVDSEAVSRILEYIASYAEDMTLRVPIITDGAVKKVTQVQKMVKYITGQGIDIPNLQAGTVEEFLKQDLPDNVRELLELRVILGRSSTAKFKKIQEMIHNGRVHGNLQYYGAGTGRWAGRGFQLHNLPRASVKNPDKYIEAFKNFAPVENPVGVAKALIRPMVCAEENCSLLVSDYSSIENRLIMWLCNDTTALKSIRAGRNQYVEMAAYMYQRTYDDIQSGYKAGDPVATHQRRIGKIIVLGCGFQMGGERFQESAAEQGVELSKDESYAAVNAFRTKHKKLKIMWGRLSKICIAAIQSTGKVYQGYNCAFKVVKCRAGNRWLVLTLPSGRNLFYMSPYISEDKYGLIARHYGVNPYTKKWSRKSLTQGRITENIIQALARDIMANGLRNVEERMREARLIGTVHDEAIAEIRNVDITGSTQRKFDSLLCKLPPWAEGLPLEAEGFIAKRYRK